MRVSTNLDILGEYVAVPIVTALLVRIGASATSVGNRNSNVVIWIETSDGTRVGAVALTGELISMIIVELRLKGRINMVGNGEVIRDSGGHAGCIRLGPGAEALVTIGDEVGDGDGCQDADDGDDDHQFDQGETFFVHLSHFAKHVKTLLKK